MGIEKLFIKKHETTMNWYSNLNLDSSYPVNYMQLMPDGAIYIEAASNIYKHTVRIANTIDITS